MKIVKEEPEDENKYTQLLINDDGLDNAAAFFEPIDPAEPWDPGYNDAPRRASPAKLTEAELQRAEENFEAAYPEAEEFAKILKSNPLPEAIIVVLDNDDDEYEPPEPSDLPVPTYTLPGLGVSADLALRPSANPFRETLGVPDDMSTLTSSAEEMAKVEAIVRDSEKLPANPYEIPRPSADAQQNEGVFIPQDYGFTGAQSVQMRIPKLDGERAPTVCFEGPLLLMPYQHKLSCGHIVMTDVIVPCGSSCEQSKTFDGKPMGKNIRCTDQKCSREAKQRDALFVPKHITHRGATPMRPYDSRPKHVYGIDASADKRHDSETGVEATKLLDGLDFSGSNTTPGRRRAMLAQQKQQARKKSALPTNVRTRAMDRDRKDGKPQEPVNEAEELLARHLKAAKGNILSFPPAVESRLTGREKANLEQDFKEGMYAVPARPRRVLLKRDLHEDSAMPQMPPPLVSNEVRMLEPEEATRTARETRAGLFPPGSEVHNVNEMVKPDRRPNAYATGGIRNEEYAMIGMTEDRHAKMMEDEDHVVIEQEDRGNTRFLTHDGRFDRENFDNDMADQDCPDIGDFHQAETHCVCESPADGKMLPCERCSKHFHPSCIGKGQLSREDYEGAARLQALLVDVEYFQDASESFSCPDCDLKAESTSQKLSKSVNAGKAVPGRGVKQILGKRGAEEAKANARELARTSRARGLMKELFGEEDDENDFEAPPAKHRKTAKPRVFAPAVESRDAIKSKIISTDADVAAAHALSHTKVSGCKCTACGKRIHGVYFQCVQCSDFNACDACVDNGLSHARTHSMLHRFEVKHASGPIWPVMGPLEASAVAEEAEALEAEEDNAKDVAMSDRLAGAVLQRPAPADNMFTRAKAQPPSAKSSAPRKKPQSRKKSVAPSKRGPPRASAASPNHGDVVMGEATEPQKEQSSQSPPQAPHTRQLRPRQSVAYANKAQVVHDDDAMVE
ncbi:hypothetical protein LTR36_000020 [Oleoguttula mirabilis]|uniref:Uncharacterized protein n=1 Tax=Oleoguttula mirabilis TaxID=1507867 RepID=A0AAV9JZ57_9PEZI|nr:hypothetical protein LTR36_000020 [Oleoguttula mirabilis]